MKKLLFMMLTICLLITTSGCVKKFPPYDVGINVEAIGCEQRLVHGNCLGNDIVIWTIFISR